MTSIASSLPSAPTSAVTDPSNPVVAGASYGQALSAVALSTEAGVVAFIGGGTPAGLTYDAAGLLNSFLQAGTTATLDPSATPAELPPTTDQSLVSGLSGATGTGYVPPASSLGTDINAEWSSVLPDSPGLAGNVVADSFDQGIVSTLSEYA